MDELIFLYVKNDKDKACDILYKNYYTRILSLARKVLDDKSVAEDCVQDIFIKIFENIEKFRFGCKIGTWIYRIALNHLITVNKKLDFFLEIDEEKLYSKIEYSVEIMELQHKIKDALNELNEVEKKVFILREMEGFSYKEISNIMEINEGTVKSKLHYVKIKLRELLEKYVK